MTVRVRSRPQKQHYMTRPAVKKAEMEMCRNRADGRAVMGNDSVETGIEPCVYKYRVLIEPAEEGGFVITVPALPGCVPQGEIRDDAVAMACDCIEGFPACLAESGEPIPVESEPADAVAVRMEVAGLVVA